MGESAELGMYVRSSKTSLFLSVLVDDIKMDEKKQNTVAGRLALGPEISTLLFFPAFRASRFHLSFKLSYKKGGVALEIRVTNNKFRALDQQCPLL